MVDVVQKYSFKGVEYDTYEAAANAETLDIRAATEKYNTTAEIEKLSRISFKYISRRKFPCYIKATDKYSTGIVLVTSIEDVQAQSMALLASRVKDGYWYHDSAGKLASAIVAASNGLAAYMFLMERSGNEYEEFELNDFDKF